MSTAAPIIGLGLQAVGTFSKPTQYTPDPQAKYQADLYALQVSEENTRQQQELVRQQSAVADDFAKYQYQQQLLQYQGQTQLGASQIESQFQAGLYQNNLANLQNEVNNYANQTNSTLQQANTDLVYENALRQGEIDRIQRMSNLNQSTLARNVQRNDALIGQGYNDSAYSIQQSGNDLRNSLLGNQYSAADLTQLDIGRQRESLGLADVGIQNQQGNINISRQNLSEAEKSLQLQENTANRGLDLASANSNILESQGKLAAEDAKGAFFRQVLQNFTGNEKEFNKYAARLGALGLNLGSQGAATQQDIYNNSDIYNQQQAQQSQYGSQIGTAQLGNLMSQAGITGQRSDIKTQGVMSRNQLGLSEMGLQQQESGLANQRAANQISRRGLDAADVSNNLNRSTLGIQGQQIQLDRQGAEVSYLQNRANLQSLLGSLDTQDSFDVFNQSLLPDVRQNYNNSVSAAQLNNSSVANDLTRYINGMDYSTNRSGIDRSVTAGQVNAANADKSLAADYNRQTQAAGANYNSALGANQGALAAALAQIAASQHGVLSSLGGIQQPAPNGGGIDWNGIGGLLSQGIQIFGNGGGGNSSSSPYSVGQGYGSYNNYQAPNYSSYSYPTYNSNTQYGTYNGNLFGR
jgi:hypothetical protein